MRFSIRCWLGIHQTERTYPGRKFNDSKYVVRHCVRCPAEWIGWDYSWGGWTHKIKWLRVDR